MRLIARFVGGGFGAKLQPQPDAILAAIAARMVGRPVKLALTRPQIFHVTTHRTDTVQRVRLAAAADGTLAAVGHEAWSDNTPGQGGYETAAQATRNIYAVPNLMTAHRLVTLNLPVAAAMRAPGEAVGLLALESAHGRACRRAQDGPHRAAREERADRRPRYRESPSRRAP